MKIKKAIYDRLQAVTAVTDLVSDRCYWHISKPLDIYPYIVMELQSADPVYHFDGVTTLVMHAFTVRVYDDQDQGAADLGDEVRTALDFHRDLTGPPVIKLMWMETEEDEYAVLTDGKEVGAYVHEQLYNVWSER